jgi:anti-sigma regulatory factor (Ser/Thr protein kinase)
VTAPTGSAGADSFLHHAFYYEDLDEYADVATAFVTDGLSRDEAVLVAVPTSRFDLLRTRLPLDEPQLQLVDMSRLGRNPGRIIPLWQDFVTENTDAGRGVRGIGEPVWAGRTPAELAECQWHEMLLNLAFANAPAFPLMCPYDVSGLDDATLDAARRSHPVSYAHGRFERSEVFAGVPDPSEDFDVPLDDPPPSADVLAFREGELRSVRRLVFERATAAGLQPHQAADLVLAANEVATNSLRHGGGAGVLRVWSDGERVVCEVRDTGRIGQALVGRRRTAMNSSGGRGLWLVHQLCDLVELRSNDGGTAVRTSICLPR